MAFWIKSLKYSRSRSPSLSDSIVTSSNGAVSRRSGITVAGTKEERPKPETKPFLSKREHQLHILGSGAVGLFLACKLRLAYPTFPLRTLRRDRDHDDSSSEHQTYPDTTMVSFQHTIDGQHRMQTIPIPSERCSIKGNPSIRNLIVTTKAFSAIEAISSVQNRFIQGSGVKTNILLLCNGALAVRDELLDLAAKSDGLTPCNIHLGYTTHGVIREKSIIQDDDFDHEHIIQGGVGHIQLPLTLGNDQNIDWTEIWNTSGLECRPAVSTDQMEKLLWFKLGTNCVINPLTALYQCTNGELISVVPDFASLQRSILDEVSAVAREDHRFRSSLSQDQKVVYTAEQATQNKELSTDAMVEFCKKVIADTENNRSSMLQDVLSNKRTEIDHLTGYVVRKGEEFGIQTPTNADILQQVREKYV